jgi:hypothetical protein
LDLLAWLRLATTDETSFVNANTQAVAGRLNREAVEPQPREGGPLSLQCWPAGTTSDIPLEELQRMAMGRGMALRERSENVVVTGTRIRRPNLTAVSPVTVVNSAELEALGDLKLYRIPEPVTLAARSQKQVAFMNRQNVRLHFVYRQGFDSSSIPTSGGAPALFMLLHNREADGLGEPLPAGRIAFFAQGADRPMLLGETAISDRAVGEDVELQFSGSTGVRTAFRMLSRTKHSGQFELIVTNDQAQPVAFEGVLGFDNVQANARLGRRNGRPLWSVTVPANGRAVLCFRGGLSADYRPNASMGTGGTCGR